MKKDKLNYDPREPKFGDYVYMVCVRGDWGQLRTCYPVTCGGGFLYSDDFREAKQYVNQYRDMDHPNIRTTDIKLKKVPSRWLTTLEGELENQLGTKLKWDWDLCKQKISSIPKDDVEERRAKKRICKVMRKKK